MNSIASLAFPYRQKSVKTEISRETSHVDARPGSNEQTLNRETGLQLDNLTLNDNEGLYYYSLQLDYVNGQRKCISMSKVEIPANLPAKEPLSYIDNVAESKPETTPLLIQCQPQFEKMKLVLQSFNVTLKEKETLIVVKTRGPNDNISQIESLLLGNTTDAGENEISKFTLDTTQQKVEFTDSFNSDKFNNDILNVFVFRQEEGNKFQHCFDFKLWICKKDVTETKLVSREPEPEPQPEPEILISDYKNAFNFVLDDGPDFRKVLNNYEQRIPLIQRNVTHLVDELKLMESNLKRLINNKNKIIEIITSFANMNPILTKFKFKQNFKQTLNNIVIPFEEKLIFFINDVCDKKLLHRITQIATFDDDKTELSTLRKNFENQSNAYYSWLKKYLSNDKDRPELKLLVKRKAFELSKFDYLNHLNNFTNNQYINELLENLFKFTSIDFNWDSINNNKKPTFSMNQIGLNNSYKVYLNVLLKYNSEKFKLRQMIEACQTNDELTSLVRFNNLTIDSKVGDSTVVTQDNLDMIFSPTTPVEEEDKQRSPHSPALDQIEKSGMLYTLGGKGKQGWHKEWVVVKDGELKEFANWRTGSAPVNNTIQIALSNVKPTNYDKRQNCFEIFTSAGNKHTFQAINENERDHWIKVLNNSKQLIDTDKLQENYKASNDNKTHQLPKDSSRLKKLHMKLEKPILSLNVSNGGNAEVLSPVSIKSQSIISKDYLKTVRSIPESNNHCCADCNSTEAVEWISMNFLVVLCINCSSGHRNMGSHVSKIKSLKLDNFNDKEVEVLLNYINNKDRNKVLEASAFNIDKIMISSNSIERLQFIKDKYLEKKFITPVENVNDLLIKSVQKVNIEDTIKYLFMGGDPNVYVIAKDSKDPITLFEYSLRKYLIVETTEGPQKYFVISEFLILNGCKIPKMASAGNLTSEAVEYWSRKYTRLSL